MLKLPADLTIESDMAKQN